MGCSCVNFPSPDTVVNDFWAALPLREKPYKDIGDVISIKKQMGKDIPQKKFTLLLESLMKSPNSNYEEAEKLFTKGLDEAKKLSNEGLLFLSLVTLGKGTKIDFVTSFIELAMTVGGLKSSIIIEDKEQKKQIKRNKLEEFLVFHVRLLCEMGIPILHSLYDNKQVFEAYWTEKVSEVKIKQYVNEVLILPYNNEKAEWIDLEQFLNANYNVIGNDIGMRNYFTADPSLVQVKINK